MCNIPNVIAVIQNGYKRRLNAVFVKRTKRIKNFLKALWRNGFIFSFSMFSNNSYIVHLKYITGIPALRSFKRVSTPSRLVFMTYSALFLKKKKKFRGNLCFLETSQGFVSSEEALVAKIGGVLLCELVI